MRSSSASFSAGMIGDDHHLGRHAGLRQHLQRFQPLGRRRGARLHGPRELRIHRRHRDADLHQVALRHPRQDVEVAHDQRRLGDDADRMRHPIEHLENAAHDLQIALDRLIGIGVGADRDHARLVARVRQLLFQQRRRVVLGEQLRFEIEAGRQAEIGVGRPRKAVDAAVLAAAIGIDRAVEADVGRVVAGDDLARGVGAHRGLERRQILDALPAVVEGDPRFRPRSGRWHSIARRGRAAAPSRRQPRSPGKGPGGLLPELVLQRGGADFAMTRTIPEYKNITRTQIGHPAFQRIQPAAASPYCTIGGWSTDNTCRFYTFEQCMTFVQGVGGSCVPNPRATQYPQAPRR